MKRTDGLLRILIIASFGFVAMSYSFYSGVASGNDLPQHFQFAQTIQDSLISGENYRNFASNANGGLGDVGLRFYPPMSYYALSIINLIFDDWYYSAMICFFLIFMIGGGGVYLWSREFLSTGEAMLAAGIYTLAPYHLNLIYNNFLLAEFAASAVFPFCFLFVTRVCRKNSLLDVAGLSISFALLILTHLPSTIICSIALAIYSLILINRKALVATSVKLAASVIISLAASSFYWLRMVTELNWIRHSSSSYISGNFDYRANFLFLPESIINWQSDILNLWLADLMLLTMVLIAVPSIILLIQNKIRRSRTLLALVAIFIFGIFMAIPLSSFIWSQLAFLQKIQFPWRWLGLISATGAIIASIGLFHLTDKMNKSGVSFASAPLAIAVVIFVFTSAFLVKGAAFIPHDLLVKNLENIGSRQSFVMWLPIWATDLAQNMEDKVSADGRKIEINEWQPLKREFTIGAGTPGEARIRTFYYPHWHAKVNGIDALAFADKDGLIAIDVPGVQSLVKLQFEEPNYVVVANFVSAAAWLAVCSCVLFALFRRRTISANAAIGFN